MKWLSLVLLLMITGCASSRLSIENDPSPTINQTNPDPTTTSSRKLADLPDLGPAPELNNEVWLNTDQPLRLADLRGKVVLLDMWTFG